jgi:hypothetical protein
LWSIAAPSFRPSDRPWSIAGKIPTPRPRNRTVGIVSITDLASGGETPRVGEALGDIARPSGLHSQQV